VRGILADSHVSPSIRCTSNKRQKLRKMLVVMLISIPSGYFSKILKQTKAPIFFDKTQSKSKFW